MKTLYSLLRERCGLSLREAADFHGIPVKTVEALSRGARSPRPGHLAELRELYERIETIADEAIKMIVDVEDGLGEFEAIEIGLASDDHEAQSLGLPCVGAHAAAIGLACVYTDRPINIVRRGTTLATAAAADAHE